MGELKKEFPTKPHKYTKSGKIMLEKSFFLEDYKKRNIPKYVHTKIPYNNNDLIINSRTIFQQPFTSSAKKVVHNHKNSDKQGNPFPLNHEFIT